MSNNKHPQPLHEGNWIMNKLFIFIGMTVFGWLGSWLAGLMKLDFFWVFIISGFASMFGIYAGWRINREFFD